MVTWKDNNFYIEIVSLGDLKHGCVWALSATLIGKHLDVYGGKYLDVYGIVLDARP